MPEASLHKGLRIVLINLNIEAEAYGADLAAKLPFHEDFQHRFRLGQPFSPSCVGEPSSQFTHCEKYRLIKICLQAM